jgi:hypothetical protein
VRASLSGALVSRAGSNTPVTITPTYMTHNTVNKREAPERRGHRLAKSDVHGHGHTVAGSDSGSNVVMRPVPSGRVDDGEALSFRAVSRSILGVCIVRSTQVQQRREPLDAEGVGGGGVGHHEQGADEPDLDVGRPTGIHGLLHRAGVRAARGGTRTRRHGQQIINLRLGATNDGGIVCAHARWRFRPRHTGASGCMHREASRRDNPFFRFLFRVVSQL